MLYVIICSSHACQNSMFRADCSIVLFQIGLQVFADNISAATLGFYCKNCECFFADTSDDIGFSKCIFEDLSSLDYQYASRLLSMSIINLFEVVHIDEEKIESFSSS